MPQPFDAVRERLETQYRDIPFDPESGLTKDELVAEFEQHMADAPDEPRIVTRAWLFHLLCTRARIAPEPDDWFEGKLEHHDLLIQLRNQWKREEEEREFGGDTPMEPGASTSILDLSHTSPDWRNLLKHGFTGLRDRAKEWDGPLYRAVAMVYDGIARLAKRFAEASGNAAMRALAQRPPRTFHEALQLAFLYHELQEMDGEPVRSMGRFDDLYNPYFVADLEAGRLTRETASEMLKYFWIKFYARTEGKWFGKPFLFGPAVNELTRFGFEVYREMQVVDPKFHVRYGEQTADDFLEQVVRCIRAGCSSIVVANNDAQVDMLVANGKAREDAEDYILIGCYEPAVMGKELNCSGSCSLNLPRILEITLATAQCESFGELMDAYIRTLDRIVTATMDRTRREERLWPQVNPTPLLSGTLDACLESGFDVSEAGAPYNTSGCCCVGLANAVDSLGMIREFVFEDKVCTLEELRAALAANWEGHEDLRLKVQKRVPKWGNNDDRVDAIAVAITDFLGKRINHEPNARGGRFQAALYGIIGTARRFGEKTGALPDGRLAGETLTMNTGATPGMDRSGVTSLIQSVTKIDLSLFPNGTVLDIMLHPSVVAGEEGVATMCSLIRSHFARGGMAIQFNVFDVDTLRAAQRDPARYANLQVRVCGWNSRFVDLTPDEQNIFIAKAEAV